MRPINSEFESYKGLLEIGLHPFTQFVHDYLDILGTQDLAVEDSPPSLCSWARTRICLLPGKCSKVD